MYAWILKRPNKDWMWPVHGDKASMSCGKEVWHEMTVCAFDALLNVTPQGFLTKEVMDKVLYV